MLRQTAVHSSSPIRSLLSVALRTSPKNASPLSTVPKKDRLVRSTASKENTKSLPPLVDTFGRNHTYLRISLTERCNLRFESNRVTNMSFSNMISAMLPAGSTISRGVRYMSSYSNNKLTHIDQDGKARMVDVGHKRPTTRVATAKANVYVGQQIAQLISQNSIAKGDVLSVSQIAGIVAAKRTSEIIPLCHNIPLSSVDVKTELNLTDHVVSIYSTVKCEGKTGVEMEALTAVSTAALTIYDMCKALSQDIIIRDIMLIKKSGGKLTYVRREDGTLNEEEKVVRNYKTDPILAEPFVPIHH